MRGVTLIEMVVAVTIVAVAGAVTTLALGRALSTDDTADVAYETARAEAIRNGIPVRFVPDTTSDTGVVILLPDGRAVGMGVDPLTGARDGGR